jgi:Zn ribbon nucleic-acid-binding protein
MAETVPFVGRRFSIQLSTRKPSSFDEIPKTGALTTETDLTGGIRRVQSCREEHCLLTLPMDTACKHPKVRVVAREEDVEYVECLDCGQVFDSNEFRDMEIEEEVEREPEEDRY